MKSLLVLSLSLAFSLSLLVPQSSQAAPVAIADDYETSEDSVLDVPVASGVLANDSAGASALLTTDVSNGTLSLNPDGSFSYIPAENFNGVDSFSYVAQETPETLTFTVDQSQSEVELSATLDAGIFNQTRSDSSSVTGSLEVGLSPPDAPFGSVQVTAMDLVLADDVSLNYNIIFIASVDVSADGGEISLSMEQPGAATTADAAGDFTQLMNDLAIDGMMDVQASGVDLGVPNGPQDISTIIEDVDLSGSLSEAGGVITLTLPVTFQGTFPIGGNSVDLEIDGTLVATAPVPTVESSAPATVTLEVDPVNDAPLAIGEGYHAVAGQAMNVPATAAGGTVSLVAAGAQWSFLDDGSDAGTAWREPGFDASAWNTGAAELGYGDTDEVTLIGFGPDANNKFPTTYFLHEFNVPALNQNAGLLLRLKRDDGAAVYINGVEVSRDNLAVGAAFDDLAIGVTGGDDETTFFESVISPSALVTGTNVIAVEVHQAGVDSSDLSFDLELLQLPVAGVLDNETDIDGDSLTATLGVPAANGTVSLAADGSFTYTANPGFSGQDEFTYVVSDGGSFASLEVIAADAEWSYLDDGSDQGTAWRQRVFNDSSWASGAAQLGYGGDGETTVVSFGGDANNKHETTYFRHSFYVGDPSAIAGLTLRLLRDDAAAVYLNGAEVFRDSTLPAGAAFDTLATAPINENAAEIVISAPVGGLIAGMNVIAVEVHQNSVTSSDLSFALSASATAPAPTVVMARGGEWSYLDDGSDQGSAWSQPAFDDSAWDSGAAPLGYGASETTTVGFGGDAAAKFATTYFRRSFEVLGAADAVGGRIRVRRDDGVALYLNGVEIVRSNLAAGASSADFAANTTGSSDLFLEFGFDASLLVEGTNVLAAEVHQASATSSDIIFDAELAMSVAQILQVAVIDVTAGANPDSDNDGILDAYELANGLTVGIDDSALDLDADGQSNLSEFLAGTIANDPNSWLRITAITPGLAGQLDLTVATVPGKAYRLQNSPDAETWQDVPASDWTAVGAVSAATVSMTGDEHFWRVRVVVP